MKSIRDFLSPEDYRNYRNIRAVAIGFVMIGAIYALGGVAALFVTPDDPDKPPLPIALKVIVGLVAIVGFSGVLGGIAVLNGSKRWSKLTYVLAGIYLLAFPLGTFLSVVMFCGLTRYLRNVQHFHDQHGFDETG